MSKLLYEKLLEQLKRANKERKVKLAKEAGYDTVEGYKSYLEKNIDNLILFNTWIGVKTPVESVTTIITPYPIIHVVDVIDASGSMGNLNGKGSKLNLAIKGMRKGVKDLKINREPVNYIYSLISFDNNISKRFVKQPIHDIPDDLTIGRHGNTTALNDVIIGSIKLFDDVDFTKEKVLINIYTDGGENSSSNSISDAVTMIESFKAKGGTLTFIGTPNDVKEAIKKYGIEESNTLSYDGSAKGLENSLEVTRTARSEYSSKVAKGEDVTLGFYKK